MAYPFVHSANDLGVAKGPRLAMCWHMAEGGGTVSYLAKPNPNGVSVHFVVEYDGTIVQMLQLDHMHSSIRSSDIRTSDDKPFVYNGLAVMYGRSVAKDVLGNWADIAHGTLGPNHATIAVEVEGFAAVGPNTKQTLAIGRLAAFIGIPAHLCHRDFQDYKPCPGKHFPWTVVGGHGHITPEDDVKLTAVKAEDWMAAANGANLYAEPDRGAFVVNKLPSTTVVRAIAASTDWRLTTHRDAPAWFHTDDARIQPVVDPSIDSQLEAFIARTPVPDCPDCPECPPSGSGTLTVALNGETLYEDVLP